MNQILVATFTAVGGKTHEVEVLYAHPRRKDSVRVRAIDGTKPFVAGGIGWTESDREGYVFKAALTNIHAEETPYIDEDPAAVDAEAAIRETQEWLDQAEIDTRRYYGEA